MKKSFLLKLSLLIPFAFSLQSCGSEPVNLNDYVKVESSGYDRIGNAELVIDYDSMVEDHFSGFGLKKNYKSSDKKEVIHKLEKKISASLDKSANLKNNDTVSLTWQDTDRIDSLEDTFSIDFSYSNAEHTIEGLTETEAIDPFDYIELQYTGISGFGGAKVNYIDNDKNIRIDTEKDKDSYLSNGDQIKVTAKALKTPDNRFYYDDDLKLAKAGYYFTEREKIYTVEGLPRYASKLSDITQDALDKNLAIERENLTKFFTKTPSFTRSTEATVHSVDMAGIYLLTPKDPEKPGNVFYIIYKISQTSNHDPDTVYYAGCHDNLMISSDGVCDEIDLIKTAVINDTKDLMTNSRWLDSIERFEEKMINPELDNFNCEKIIY